MILTILYAKFLLSFMSSEISIDIDMIVNYHDINKNDISHTTSSKILI